MTLDERFKRTVDTLGDKFRDELARELELLSQDWSALEAAAAQAKSNASSELTRLADSLRALDYAKSLTEILDHLATAASNEGARAGVFLIKGNELRSFRLFGFPANFEDKSLELPLGRCGVLGDAIAQRTAATGASSPFDDALPGVQVVAVPIVLAGTAVGVVYAKAANPQMIEILTRFASRALEAMTATKAARAVAGLGTTAAEVDVV